jgi:hypothetical protein
MIKGDLLLMFIVNNSTCFSIHMQGVLLPQIQGAQHHSLKMALVFNSKESGL